MRLRLHLACVCKLVEAVHQSLLPIDEFLFLPHGSTVPCGFARGQQCLGLTGVSLREVSMETGSKVVLGGVSFV